MSNAEEVAANVLDFAEDLDDNIEEGLDSGMDDTKDEAKQNLRDNDSVVNRSLISSIYLLADTPLEAKHTRQVIVDAPHAPYVEYGTGQRQEAGKVRFKAPDPGPPIGKIKQWMIAKGLYTLSAPNLLWTEISGPAPRANKSVEERLDDWAHVIADSIAEHGNRPHPYARPAARKGFKITLDRVRRQMKRSVRRY